MSDETTGAADFARLLTGGGQAEPVEPQPESEPQTHEQTIMSLLAQKADRDRALFELLHPARSEEAE